MDDIEQKNKKHLNPKSGRKVKENSKIKLDDSNRVDYKDSKGQSFIKAKKKVNQVNKKAFAIQNIVKAKKKVALVVDRQTTKHTYRNLSDQYTDAPQLICLVGPPNSGKSTLLRTLMRHYTNHRLSVKGPVTVVTSKKKRATFFECPNDLHSQIDIAKTADTILLMINVKQGIQNSTFEFLELLNPHGVPRIKIIFTHLDEFTKNDKQLQTKMKFITKRIQVEVHALPFRLSGIMTFRTAGNSEYKREEVKNLARLIGQKNPLPNEWRENHPYIFVDRLEKMPSLDSTFDAIKFYGYVRGCTMSNDINMMHLMGVSDLVVDSVELLNEPCPTPLEESKGAASKKRQPLEIKERKAYAPMSGYGGVLRDSEGFHIVTNMEKDLNKKKRLNSESSEDEDDIMKKSIVKSSLIRDDEEDESSNESDENHDTNEGLGKRKYPEDLDEDSPTSNKRRCIDDNEDSTKNLISGFAELQDSLKTDHSRINYEKLIYDDEYSCNLETLERLQNDDRDLSIDLFVAGKWDENEDAATLLKKDDEGRKNIRNTGGDSEDEDEDGEDEDDEDIDEEDEELISEIVDSDAEEQESVLEGDIDEEMDDNDEEMDDDDEEICDDDEEMDDDDEEMDDGDEEMDDDEEYEHDSAMDDNADDDEEDSEKDTGNDTVGSKKPKDLFEGLVSDTANMTEFQKKRLERESKTKRQKKLEKKAKHKALFDKLYDQKQGDSSTNSTHFDKWKEANEQQSLNNKTAFEHLEQEDAHLITGLRPGRYISVTVKKVPKEFHENFDASRPVVLGGLAPGEESIAMLTASFKLSRHFDTKSVLKTEDPICMSIGWRRIQSFCYFFKEEDNLRKTYLKYSREKGLFCRVAFMAPVVPVKTGFSAFIDFEPHEKFRVAAIGSVLTKDDTVDIKKKLKRVGEPAKVFHKTAFVQGMFSSELEVIQYSDSLLRTSSGVRGAVKKPLSAKLGFGDGAFRATFEAPIFMSDLVTLTCWVTVPLMKGCQLVQNLLVAPGGRFQYWKLWNQFYLDKGIPRPGVDDVANDKGKDDSKYRPIVRKPFVAAPITLSKKVIEKLPFINRPVEPELEDEYQKSRPRAVLDPQDSRKAQLVESLLRTNEERRQKQVDDKQKYRAVKHKKLKAEAEKDLEKKKKQRKVFFKNKSIKRGEAKRKKPADKD